MAALTEMLVEIMIMIMMPVLMNSATSFGLIGIGIGIGIGIDWMLASVCMLQ